MRRRPLLLEQLEERIFLDANPVAVVDAGMDPVDSPVESVVETAAPEPEAQNVPATVEQDDESGAGAESYIEPDSNTAIQDNDTPVEDPEAEEFAEVEDRNVAEEESVVEGNESIERDVEVDSQAEEGEPEFEQIEPVNEESTADQENIGSTDADLESDLDEIPVVSEQSEDIIVDSEAIDPMIGEDFTFTVHLDNTTTDTLYGPYIDLYLPSSGDDGAGSSSDPILAAQGVGDGATFVNANFLGTDLNESNGMATVNVFDSTGEILHPFAVDANGDPITVSGTPGDTYVTVELPLGSVTENLPVIDVEITAHIDKHLYVDPDGGALEDFDVDIYNGFRFGTDPLDNPASDTPDPPALVDTQTFRPEVIRFQKVYDGPEQETATGPNYAQTYTITVDVATGQTVNGLQIIENLPDDIYYMGDLFVTGGSVVSSPGEGIWSGENLIIDLGDVTGAAGTDATVTFQYYVPAVDAGGIDILDPCTGLGTDPGSGVSTSTIINDMQLEGDWTPLDPDDTPAFISVDAEVDDDGNISPTPSIDETFTAQSIAVQKGASLAFDTGLPGYSPGDIVQYTLEFQISDYFSIGDLAIDDLLADGMRLDTSGAYAPRFDITDRVGSHSGTFDALDYSSTIIVDPDPAVDGDQSLIFNVSGALQRDGELDGILEGGYTDGSSGIAAIGTITYFAEIQDQYQSVAPPSDTTVSQGDSLSNSVRVSGSIYGYDADGNLVHDPSCNDDISDDSSAIVEIATGSVHKNIFAVNSETNPGNRPHITPGDTITYRLTYDLTTTDFENLSLNDFLPLPVFNAAEVTSFSNVDNDNDGIIDAGYAWFGANDSLGITPTLSSGTDNNLTFDFGSNASSDHSPKTVEVIFTVTVSADPFADGLHLANMVVGTENGTISETGSGSIIDVILDEPKLDITKGVVQAGGINDVTDVIGDEASIFWSDHVSNPTIAGFRFDGTVDSTDLAANPVDDDLTGADAADYITFAMAIENSGHASAFDINISDVLPSGYSSTDVSNLTITDGTGDIISWTGDSGNNVASDLFTVNGITLDDDIDGLLPGINTPTPGDNIILVTYDVLLTSSVVSGQTLTNTISLNKFSNIEAGDNFIPDGLTDPGLVTIAEPVVDKEFVSTGIENGVNGSDEAVIGETVHYRLTVTVPEGETPALEMIDRLDLGLGLVSVDSVVLSGGLTADNPAGIVSYTENSSGQDILAISFGDVQNSNTDNSIDDTIIIEYTALVLNIGNNQSTANEGGPDLNNSVLAQWEIDQTVTTSTPDSADPVSVIEPVLEVLKSVTVDGTTDPDQVPGDDGDPVLYTIVIQHAGTSETDAFDVQIEDVIPLEVTGLSIQSVTDTGGLLGTADFMLDGASGNILTLDPAGSHVSPEGTVDIPFSNTRVITVVVAGTLGSGLNVGDLINNRADIDWSSLPGPTADNSDLSVYITTGDSERDGSGGVNDYVDTDPADILVGLNSIDKVLVSSEINEDGTMNLPVVDDGVNSGREVVIGEELTYQLTVTLAEGESPAMHVLDTLDPGLSLVRIDSLVLSSIGDISGSNIAALQAAIAAGLNAPSDSAHLSYINDSTGNDILDIDLGDVINTNTDNSIDETITITYTVMATDIPASSVGTEMDNLARVTWHDSTSQVVESAPVTADFVAVIEPELNVTKDAVINGGLEGDAGDAVEYTIRIEHTGTSGAEAFDTTLSDLLPDQVDFSDIDFTNGTDVTVTDSDGVLDANDFRIGAGGILQFALDGDLTDDSIDIAVTRVITIALTGTLQQTVQPSELIENSADITWTTIDGDRTDHSGFVPGSAEDQERSYLDTDSADISVPSPDIDKQGTGDYTIGEGVPFTITVTLPEGTTHGLVVEDLLPDGLIIDDPMGSDIIITTPGNFGTLPDPTISYLSQAGADTLTLDFGANGNVVVTGDPGSSNNSFTITIMARVENVINNHDGEVLQNEAVLRYDDAQGNQQIIGPDDSSITLVEPQITTVKDVVDTSGDQTVAVLGESLTYTVRFENSGSSTAFEVDALDTLAPGTGFVTLDSVIYHTTATSSDIDITGLSYGTDNGNGTISFGSTDDNSWDLAVDDYIEVVYSAQVLGSWFVPGSHINTIDADWTGLDGDDPNERIYDDTPDRNPGMSQDGSQDEDTAEYTVPDGDGSLGDRVWFDSNGDGIQDVGEPGVSDVTVTAEVIFNGTTLFSETTTTDGNGMYYFTDLQGATYQVTVDENSLPSGMFPTYDLDGIATPHTATVPLGMTESRDDVDFGYDGLDEGKIGDYIWYDANSDGVQDVGETGIAGALVRIEGDINSNGLYEYTAFTTTDADGGYLFTNLPGVDYIVTVMSLPHGFDTQTYDPDGPPNDDAGFYSLAANESYLDMDFGYVGSGQIGDLVWDDFNADGVADTGEPGLDGVSIILEGDLDGDGHSDFTLQTITSGGGVYDFNGLPAANYTVTIDTDSLPPGYIQSGDPDGQSGLDNSSRLVLAQDESDLLQDFGYTKTGSIGDTIWYDVNANSVQDRGEPGLVGVTVTLTGDVDLDGIPDTLTTVTDATGQYLFGTLPTGNYTITVSADTLPGGMRQTYDADGIGTAHTTAVDLGYGEDILTTDFGYTGTGAIGDTVWIDSNRNGIIDGGESGIGGVGITLSADFDRDGTVDYTATMNTDGSGIYLFSNLPSGNYNIVVDSTTIPSGLEQVFDPDGLLDHQSALRLGAGENNLSQDFGYARPVTPAPPVVPPAPIIPPVGPPVPGDVVLMYQFSESGGEDIFLFPEPEEIFMPPPIPVSPVYTGLAEPGTTLSFVVYDAMGNSVGHQTVMADTGGNWLVSFTGTLLYDMPHRMEISQTASLYNNSTPGLFNLRSYFNPTMTGLIFSSTRLDIQSITAYEAASVGESLHQENNVPLNLGWNDFSGYEFFSPSINPAQHKR